MLIAQVSMNRTENKMTANVNWALKRLSSKCTLTITSQRAHGCTEIRRQQFKNTRKVARHRRKNGRNVQLKTLKID